jgi:hypothetical protein
LIGIESQLGKFKLCYPYFVAISFFTLMK